MFERAIPLLAAAGLRVIAVDTSGYGNSDAPPEPPSIAEFGACLGNLLDGLQLERAHFLGTTPVLQSPRVSPCSNLVG